MPLPRPAFFSHSSHALLLFGVLAWCLRAQSDLSPQTQFRSWEFTTQLRSAAGYKDNLLLSALRSESSAFAQAELEAFLWRLPDQRFEVLIFGNATFTRFVQSEDYPHESQAFVHAEGRWFARPTFEVTGTIEGYHMDQVFDVSSSDAERITARLNMRGATTTTSLRWRPRADTYAEIKPGLQRDRYDDHSDDNWQRFARIAVGHVLYGGRIDLTAAFQLLRRDYDGRPRYTVAGRPLVGTDLDFDQREGELAAVVAWDSAKTWKSTTAVSAGNNRDNGSGYFDYDRRSLRQEISWSGKVWKCSLTGRLGRFDYGVQTVGIGINPPKRRKDEFLARLRVERSLGQRVTAYAEAHWEQSHSNDPLASYRSRALFSGLGWSF